MKVPVPLDPEEIQTLVDTLMKKTGVTMVYDASRQWYSYFDILDRPVAGMSAVFKEAYGPLGVYNCLFGSGVPFKMVDYEGGEVVSPM